MGKSRIQTNGCQTTNQPTDYANGRGASGGHNLARDAMIQEQILVLLLVVVGRR
jgi:hypothetical protein